MIPYFIKKHGAKKILLSTSDLASGVIALFIAMYLTSAGNFAVHFQKFASIEKLIIFLAGVYLILPLFRYYQLYKHKYFLKTGEQTLLILKALLIDSIIIILLLFIVKTQETLQDSRMQVIIYFLVSFALIFTSRVVVLRNVLRYGYIGVNIKGFFTRRAIAIGSGNLGQFFSEIIAVKPYYHIELVGFLDDDRSKKGKKFNSVKVLGTTDDILDIVEKQEIDEIYITIQSIDNKKLLELIEKCKLTDCQVNLVSNHFEIIDRKLDENEYHDMKVICVSSKVSPLYSEKFKRLFDIVVSSLLMVVLSVPAMIISLLIKLDSRGPSLFKATVIGKDGKLFNWYKFRTMYHLSDHSSHQEHLKKIISLNTANLKLMNDPRVTRVGRLLRKFSIDELPQLINVIRGEMSLVGPRPCLPYEYETFNEWHRLKYKVIPGMTGLAQIVARNRTDVTFSDSVMLDLYYADNQSLWLDLKILFKTIPVMVFGRGGV